VCLSVCFLLDFNFRGVIIKFIILRHFRRYAYIIKRIINKIKREEKGGFYEESNNL